MLRTQTEKRNLFIPLFLKATKNMPIGTDHLESIFLFPQYKNPLPAESHPPAQWPLQNYGAFMENFELPDTT